MNVKIRGTFWQTPEPADTLLWCNMGMVINRVAGHIAEVKNVRIIEIYKRYKLADTKYALTDVTTYTGARWKWQTWKWRTIEMSRHEIDGHENTGHVSGVWIGLHGIDFDLAVLPSNRLLLRFQECSRPKSKLKTIRLYSDDHCVFHPCPSQKKDACRVCRWDTEHCRMHGIVSETLDISWYSYTWYFRWYFI